MRKKKFLRNFLSLQNFFSSNSKPSLEKKNGDQDQLAYDEDLLQDGYVIGKCPVLILCD